MKGFPFKLRGLIGFGMASTERKYGMSLLVFDKGISYGKNSDFYFEIGANLEFGPAVPLFIMVRYIGISTEGESTKLIPITVGLKF